MQCKFCHTESASLGEAGLCSDCERKLQAAVADSSKRESQRLRLNASPPPPAAPVQTPASRGREVWRSGGTERCPMAWPFSVAVHPNGEIFVLDEPDEYRILRLDRAGHCLGTWVEIPATDEEGGVEDPQGLCIDAAGVVYVPDAANDRISVWNADGTFSRWIGGTGAKPGQFAHPRDVEVDEDGFLYVADSFNHRIQKLSADGVLSLNIHDLGPLGKFAEPRAITADADGNILVADGERNQVILLSSEGRPRKAWPGTDGQPCTFDGLGDVRVDPDGALYVSDRGNLRIRRLSPDGQVTGVIDRSAPETEMTEAGDIAILDGKVVIPDRFNDCVYCLAFEEPATEPPDKDTP